MKTAAHAQRNSGRFVTTLLGAAAVIAMATSLLGAALPASAATTAPPVADGYYRLELAALPGFAMGKTTTCADGAGGTVYFYPTDTSNYKQKFLLIHQPSGKYLVASACQPTVYLTDAGQADITLEYGTNGRVGAVGSWDLAYNYNQPHTSAQEWDIAPVDGHIRLSNARTGADFALLDLVPTS